MELCRRNFVKGMGGPGAPHCFALDRRESVQGRPALVVWYNSRCLPFNVLTLRTQSVSDDKERFPRSPSTASSGSGGATRRRVLQTSFSGLLYTFLSLAGTFQQRFLSVLENGFSRYWLKVRPWTSLEFNEFVTFARTRQYMSYDYSEKVFLHLPGVVSAECTGPTEGTVDVALCGVCRPSPCRLPPLGGGHREPLPQVRRPSQKLACSAPSARVEERALSTTQPLPITWSTLPQELSASMMCRQSHRRAAQECMTMSAARQGLRLRFFPTLGPAVGIGQQGPGRVGPCVFEPVARTALRAVRNLPRPATS